MNLVKLRNIFQIVVVILFSLYTYKSVFSGKLLGEPFDARLMITLHEHMWRWLNGEVSFRDTEFFYPYSTALGYSDVFLVQGIIYSIFRFIGLDSLSSWLNVTILLVVIGNLGWVAVAKKFLNNFFIQVLFVLTMVSSLSFVHYFVFNANVVGYSFLSWIILFLLNIFAEQNKKRLHIKINLFIITLIIYALSCWYAAFFLFTTMAIRFIMMIMSSRFSFRFMIGSIRKFYKVYLFFAPAVLFFSWLFYYVYISVATQPERSLDELIRNSPRIQNILVGADPNRGAIDGALFSNIYKYFKLDYPIVFGNQLGDWGGGLGLIVPILLVAILLLNIFLTKKVTDYGWIIAVIITYCYLMVLGNDKSVHSLLFNHIPGLNSIRSPSRYIIIIGFAAILLIFYYFDQVFSKTGKIVTKFFIFIVLLTVFMDQQRSSFIGWDRQIFINAELMALKEEIQNNCDYFYYDKPGGWWFDQIEALSFAVQIGVPTVNGYSGAYPPSYPNKPWTQDSPSVEIFDWINRIDKEKRGCFILGDSKVHYSARPVSSIYFYGFTEKESKGISNWRWSISRQSYLLIIGEKNARHELDFEIAGSPCFARQNFEISLADSDDPVLETTISKSQRVNLNINLESRGAQVLKINTDSDACILPGDPRELFFEVKNITLS